MFALVDCNNFYVSCERLFKPALANKPILVLSNNDGCVIARSNEVKALGVQMGVPYFAVKALCKQHKVHVFSSNYTLYADMSRRVMSVLEDNWPAIEIYSIDEAFLDLNTLPQSEHNEFCHKLQKIVLRYTGIPVSIGIGATKTLAKLANHIAKKELRTPVFNIENQYHWLAKIVVGEVWGIGRQWGKKLVQQGIYTAHDLAGMDLQLIKKLFSVVLQRTVLELRGVSCGSLQDFESRKSIISSKSFGSMQTEYSALAQAISSHCARAWEKLRHQKLMACHLSIFIKTNQFRLDLPQYQQTIGFKLINPTDDLRHLIRCAKLCLRKIFRSGFHYQKVGVYLGDLIEKNCLQLDLFNQISEKELNQTERLMSVLDEINTKYGRHTLRLAAEGYVKPWAMRAQSRSPRYTTSWSELPVVII
ncbi:Y-family DNA polymerase [Legionella pneumophila serogroup 1]|uniref:Y-family DNA polymerase n=1 Tax=Legionella pneumophila TaxID=446 RepID=UPI0007709751|nr:Y-family DNA polymerase [Legionella pneumophila]MCZ4748910.1 Y-family DNA polymerase [Legionella pneumophila]CZP45183.1 DNA polymerase V subunit UmuC [Legionella pneumophila]CZP90783.1 DNA polymerase V subunit UmuC [Legionella pneumophila]HBD7271065.1 Y-family DNA polymerase [Legionella pneumophila]HBD7305521.1 Y-family DNA polymerase [Legionella pneumophila]